MGSTTSLGQLVRAAADIYAHPERVPPATRSKAALQHLSAAGVVRSVLAAHADVVPDLPAGPVQTAAGVQTRAEDAVALHAGLAGWLELDDHLLRGRSCAATAAAAWAGATADHTWDQVLAATVAGNELSGRLGLATLLGGSEWGHPPGTAAATALVTGLLAGRDVDALTRSVAHAMSGPVQAVSDRPTTRPLESSDARSARRGVASLDADGDVGLLAGDQSLLHQWSWRPLPGALAGMGQVWLTDTLTVRTRAMAPAGQTAVEAVAEILARHVKAADKRLRVDQVERIVVRVPAAAAGLGVPGALEPASVPWSVPNLLGVLVARHALGAADLAPEVLAARAADITHVAERVEWVVDRRLSAQAVVAQLRVLGPLMGDVGWKDARTVLLRLLAGRRRGGPPSREQLAVWSELVRSLWAHRGHSTDLSGISVDGWQLHLPVQVELYTTRGGRWPERRSLPEGAPGADWAATVDGVLARFDAAAGATAAGAGRALWEADGSVPALPQVSALMGVDGPSA